MKNILKAKLIIGLIMVVGFGTSTTAYGGSVTINFTATAFSTSGIWAGQGTAVTGSYTYDDTLVDILQTNTALDKFQSNVGPALNWSLTFTLGATTRTITAPAFTFVFTLQDKAAGNDIYSFNGTRGSISLTDNDGDAITAADLLPLNPTLLPVFGDYGGLKRANYIDNLGEGTLLANIDYIGVAQNADPISLPEPGTLALLATGLLVGGVATFRKKFQ